MTLLSSLNAEGIVSSSQVVECTGLPGSGKTYFCAALSEGFRTLGRQAQANSLQLGGVSRMKRTNWKIWLCVQALMHWPKATVTLTHWIWRQDLPRARRLVLSINAISVLPFYRKTARVILLDQGLVQIAWAVLYHLIRRDKELVDGTRFRHLLEQIYGDRRIQLVEVHAQKGWHAAKLAARENWTEAQETQWYISLTSQQNAQHALWTLLDPILEPKGSVRVTRLENRRDAG
ncbi:MAG: hypothetical protein AB8B94_16515 [Hyphomicrobiales bacterium]